MNKNLYYIAYYKKNQTGGMEAWVVAKTQKAALERLMAHEQDSFEDLAGARPISKMLRNDIQELQAMEVWQKRLAEGTAVFLG